jgi:hypothetical protein
MKRKLTISQANECLREHGYAIEGVAGHDLKTRTTRYRVRRPDGDESVMSSRQIRVLIETGNPPLTPSVVLECLPIYGNAHDDAALFRLAHEIVMDWRAADEDRIAALQKMEDAVGEGGRCAWADVVEYVDFQVADC